MQSVSILAFLGVTFSAILLLRQVYNEKTIRKLGLKLRAIAKGEAEKKTSHVGFRVVAVCSSPFSTRNGTPRQPSLVHSPCALTLLDDSQLVPKSLLRHLELFSHVWVIFVFNQNTNLHKSKLKSVISPPFADVSVGVFASRTPHRPNPIGLSLCKLVKIDHVKGIVFVNGLDLVHGTPILDIKPYIPFSDSVVDPVVPHWVDKDAHLGNFVIKSVEFTKDALVKLESCFASAKSQKGSVHPASSARLFENFDFFKEFVSKCLLNDIRSTRERENPKQVIYRVIYCDIVIFYRFYAENEWWKVVVVDSERTSDNTRQPLN